VTLLATRVRVCWSQEEQARQGLGAVPAFLPLPAHQSAQAAGLDLLAAVSGIIRPAPRRQLVPTGLCIELPAGAVGLVVVRSGLSVQYGLRLVNGVGVVDSDFRGEVRLHLTADEDMPFQRGDRLAQIVVANYRPVAVELSLELGRTDRGLNGWGSTGGHRP